MEKKVKKAIICGHFGGNKEFFDGQTIKTKSIYNELVKEYGKENIEKLDTYGWKKNKWKFLKSCIKETRNSENIIIMTAHNGVKILLPLFAFINIFYKRKLFYVVIGAWIGEVLRRHRILRKCLKKYNGILVETNVLKDELKQIDSNYNIYIMNNFKRLTIIGKKEKKIYLQEPYKICVFSRIMEEKGIDDITNVLDKINEERIIYHLDLYGMIDKKYEAHFFDMLKNRNTYMHYRGIISFDQSTDIIKKYFMLVFPTRFRTEGIPGTIIDAFAAGTPVVAARWNSCNEIIEDNYNGLTYEMGNIDELYDILIKCSKNPSIINSMNDNCIKSAERYMPDNAMQVLIDLINKN